MKERGASPAVWMVAGLVAAGVAGGPGWAAGQGKCGGPSTAAQGIYEEGEQVGVKFDVLMEQNGRLRRVSSNYAFRSGDRFKFQVETNRSAFIYVLNRTLPGDARSLQSKGIEEIRDEDRRDRSGSRREYTLLYPGAGRRPAAVAAGRAVELPPGGFYRMDDNPGIEKLYVLASERRIDDIDRYFDSDGRQRPGRRPRGGGSTEGDVLDQLNTQLSSWGCNAGMAFADPDADSKGIEVAGYGVVRDREGPGSFEVSLKHLPRR